MSAGVTDKAYPCPSCPKVFRSARALAAHRRAHLPMPQCVVCSGHYRRMAEHWRRKHTDEMGTLLPVLEAQEERLADQALQILDLTARLERSRF